MTDKMLNDMSLSQPVSGLVQEQEEKQNAHHNALPGAPTVRYQFGPRRWEIWFAQLGSHPGTSIQQGCRPVLVISNNISNTKSDIVTVIPLTSKVKKPWLPSHTPISETDVQCLDEKFLDSTVLTEQLTIDTQLRVFACKQSRTQMAVDKVFELFSVALIRHRFPPAVHEHRGVFLFELHTLQILFMEFICPAESSPESRIDKLYTFLFYFPDFGAITAECKFLAKVDRYLTDASVHFDKSDARAKRAGFLSYIAYFPGTEPGECLKAQTKSNVSGIAERHRKQDLHRLCRDVAKCPVMVFNADCLKSRD